MPSHVLCLHSATEVAQWGLINLDLTPALALHSHTPSWPVLTASPGIDLASGQEGRLQMLRHIVRVVQPLHTRLTSGTEEGCSAPLYALG